MQKQQYMIASCAFGASKRKKRLTAARVLIVNCTGLAAEVAKNIVLAGVGSVTLVDDTPCSSYSPQNFLITPDAPPEKSVAEECAATLQEMNPLVHVKSLPGSILDITEELLDDYDLVLLTNSTLANIMKFDHWCSAKNKNFYAANSRGTTSYFFANLHKHEYLPTEKTAAKQGEKKSSSFSPFSAAMSTSWSKLKPKRTHKLIFVLGAVKEFEAVQNRSAKLEDFEAISTLSLQMCKAEQMDPSALSLPLLKQYLQGTMEFPPVNAVTGGVLANEIVKAVSQKGEPINNLFFFCLEDGVGTVHQLAG